MSLHNIKTVIGFEYIRTINKPSFWIATLAIPAIFGFAIGLLILSERTTQNVNEETRSQLENILVIDESGLVSEDSLTAINAQSTSTKELGIQSVRDSEAEVFIYYPRDIRTQSIEVYASSSDLGSSTTYDELARELIRQSVVESFGDDTRAAILAGQFDTKLTTYSDGEQSNLIQKAIIPGLFLILFYALVIILSNQMLTSTTEEKENRTVEMVLTTLKPRVLILGKMFAIILAGLTQVIVIVSPAILALIFFRDQLTQTLPINGPSELIIEPVRIAFAAAYFVFGFLIFTSLNVIAGALAPSAKEAGAFYGASIFSMFIPFYALGSLTTAPDSLVTKVFTFFPPTQPVTLLIRNAVGNLGSIEQWIALIIMIVSAIGGIALAVRAFRYGALQYERKVRLSELLPHKRKL